MVNSNNISVIPDGLELERLRSRMAKQQEVNKQMVNILL